MLHQLRYGNFIVINIGDNAIDDLRKVMWRHVSSHSHGNSGSTVQQADWEACPALR